MKWLYRVPLIILLLWLLLAQGCMKFRLDDKQAITEFAEAGVQLEVNTFKYKKHKLHYAQTGADTDTTILFIHGSPGAWSAFEEYMMDKDLLSRFRMISIDRPGFGYSDYGNALDLSDQESIIAAFIEHMDNGKPVYVVGHSLGGPLCVLLAAKHKQDIDGAVLLSASVDPAEETPERWRPLMASFPLKYLLPGAFRPSNIELWHFKNDVQLMPAALKKVQCPVIIVHGLNDGMVPVENATYAQKELTAASSVKMVLIKGASHFIPWSNYSKVKQVLLTL